MRNLPVFVFLLCHWLSSCTPNEQFDLGANAGAGVYLDAEAADYLRLAATDLVGDLEKITGYRPELVNDQADCQPCIVLECDSSFINDWERYAIDVTADDIRIRGGSDRALMFGIYHFLEHQLGVDPLYFWSGREPAANPELALEPVSYDSGTPDFKYRGWFINDEDLLTEWMPSGGRRNIRYPFYGDVVNPEALRHVVEAAARLRFNLMIPASFLDIANPPEKALADEVARRGLFLSMHHIEPLGVSAFTYENYWAERGEEPLFSFYSEREKVEQTWWHYAGLWAEYPDVIWQVGLRGIGDRPMWMADPGVPQSDADRAGIISDAMYLQRDIIREIAGDTAPVMTTTLWAEGSYFNQQGLLDIPEDVITVFADNNPGWHWQADFHETERQPDRRYGVYYHHQVWGWGPHLAQAIPPWQTAKVLREAYATNADDYAILNVSTVREFLPGLAASSDMLWDMEAFDGHDFLADWAEENFPSAPEAVHEAYKTYFNAYAGFGPYGMPGFLDGQSKYDGQGILRNITKIHREGYRPPAPETNRKQADPFHAAMSGADPKGSTSREERLALLNDQLAGFARADDLCSRVRAQLHTEPERQLLTANLQTPVRIQRAIGSWLRNLLLAERALQDGETGRAEKLVRDAASHLAKVEAAKADASIGRWENWYRGDKKVNVPGMLEQTERVITQLSGK